jgi:exo-beta-1,3-glucanase (GH17 family)
MSRAKLSKRSQSEIKAAIEIYNSKYIPAVREASGKVKYAKNTQEDSDAIARYNQLVPTYNDLKQQIHSLSGCLGI